MGNNSLVKLMIVHDMKDLVLRLQPPPPKKKYPKELGHQRSTYSHTQCAVRNTLSTRFTLIIVSETLKAMLSEFHFYCFQSFTNFVLPLTYVASTDITICNK